MIKQNLNVILKVLMCFRIFSLGISDVGCPFVSCDYVFLLSVDE